MNTTHKDTRLTSRRSRRMTPEQGAGDPQDY
jgi:hypothetical protein